MVWPASLVRFRPEQFGCQICIDFSLTSSFCWIYLDSCSTSSYTDFAALGGIRKLWTTRLATRSFIRTMVWA